MNDPLPTTADELNDWIRHNFDAFEGPARAYFELPFHIAEHIEMTKRVSYITFALVGPERDCALAIAASLRQFVNADRREAIFIRRWFTYEEKYRDNETEPSLHQIYGRLALWRSEWNPLLAMSSAYKPDIVAMKPA